MNKQADDEVNKPWLIRDVPEHTRREVKTYAVQHGMTVAEALEYLINLSVKLDLSMSESGTDGQRRKVNIGTLTGEDREEVTLLAETILQIMELRKRKAGDGKAE